MKRWSGWSRRRRLGLAITLLVLAMVAGKGFLLADAALEAKRDADAALALARDLQREPGNAGLLAGAALTLQAVAGSLERLQGELETLRPAFGAARLLPEGAAWIADVPDAIAVAVPLARAGAVAVRPFSAAAGDPSTGQGRLARYLAAAAALGPEAPELARRMEEAEAALAGLRGRRLGGPLRPVAPLFERLPDLLPEARRGLDLLPVVGPALGMDRPRTYLLLGQNSGEIRATGGFLGSAGTITLEGGAVVGLEYGSSYSLDTGAPRLDPPAPLARYLGLGGWYLRDANWWPDFPATAAQVEQAWLRAGKAPVDGVIAFDSATVEALLRGIGGLEVEGYGKITADSFERVAAEQLYSQAALFSGEAFHKAKGVFLGALGKALAARLLDLSPGELLPLGKEVLGLLEEKHLQLAFKDRRLIPFLRARGWDGAIPTVEGDSLYVVDTSVSYGDTYQFVESRASVLVKLAEKGLGHEHQVVLSYSNRYPRGLPPWMPPTMVGGMTFDADSGKLREQPGFWGDWLRVYLPADARDIAVEGLEDPAAPERQFDRTVVAGYLPVPPGGQREVRLRYTTEAGEGAAEGRYRLFLQKQAGLECRSVSVEAQWPDGSTGSYQGCPAGDGWIEVPRAPE